MRPSPAVSRSSKSPLRGAACFFAACLALQPMAAGAAQPQAPDRPDATAPAVAETSVPAPRVDSARVLRLYLAGDFAAAIAILEENLKEAGQYSHGDSVFILKHLGVMYAAGYDSREMGRYYMGRLLEVEPTAKILDMYAGDMNSMISKSSRGEFEAARMSSEKGKAGKQPPQATRPSGNARRWIWAGVAAATVATGVGTYLVMRESAVPPPRTHLEL